MGDTTKYIVGTLLLLLFTTGIIYITMDNVKMRVDNDKTTFYVKLLNENGEPYGPWRVSGREYNKLFEGNSLKYRDLSSITIDTTIDDISKIVTVKRFTKYQIGPVIIDTYTFDGNFDDPKLFPIEHKIELINASGYIYQYEVRDLQYDGPTIKNIESPQEFGYNMKIEWDDNSYWNTVYKSDIFKARWKPTSDYEVVNVRLFDPPGDGYITWTNVSLNATRVHRGDTINVTVFVSCEGSDTCIQNITLDPK